MGKILYTCMLTLLCLSMVHAQPVATITGQVRDVENNQAVDLATVFVRAQNLSTETDENGRYSLQVPANIPLLLEVSRIGYKNASYPVSAIAAGTVLGIDIDLVLESSSLEVIIRESNVRNRGMIRENLENLKLIPSVTGNFESILPHIALGTSSGTGGELSSQYNVRGGNYDENLVFVNDFEVYRPQLVRSGQQEGLTFPNADLIRDMSFSSGGFEARYGDKLSSVLDI
ncbi:MAG TPA: carboxypeptidase-like regulatory domain-containing protein, partial [Saprospiraceae bacterium]|nr:carboxypeptidase-like regulatory domain-containing protein [Saprospiraceae bacterium]